MGAFAAVLVAGLTAGFAAAAAKPDLVTSGVRADAYAHVGGTLAVSAVVKARYKRVRRSTTLTFFLSHDRRRSAADLRLRRVKVRALRAGHSVRVGATAPLPRSFGAAGPYHVVACADTKHRVRERKEGNNCASRASATAVTFGPMESVRLIGQAVAAGALSAHQGLVYRVWSLFGDKRLPARFRGDNAPFSDDLALRDAIAAWPSLSSRQRAQIAPYLVPPAAAGSWANHSPYRVSLAARSSSSSCPAIDLERDPDWTYADDAAGHVRIWWLKKASWNAKAVPALLSAIDTKIWPRFTRLLGREPLSDAGVPCFHGGNGRYDIYLDQTLGGRGGRAITTTWKGMPCAAVPAFTIFATWSHDPPDVKAELTHELFHGFQFAFPKAVDACNEYTWFDEGSAEWASAWMWGAGPSYADDWDTMLTQPCCSPLDEPFDEYASWIFDYFLAHRNGAPVIRDVYENFGSMRSLPAINAASAYGLTKEWRDFTRTSWNQKPLTDTFRAWDPAITQVPRGKWTKLTLAGRERRTAQLPTSYTSGIPQYDGSWRFSKYDMEYLSRRDHLLEVSDQRIRSLTFENTLAGIPTASVQALYQTRDPNTDETAWHKADWTGKGTVRFCRTDPDENVQKLVVFYANEDWQGKKTLKPSKQPTLILRSDCDLHYRVTGVSGSYEFTASFDETGGAGCSVTGHDHYDLGFRSGGTGTVAGESLGLVDVNDYRTGGHEWTRTCPAPQAPQTCSDTIDDAGGFLVEVNHDPGAQTAEVKFDPISRGTGCSFDGWYVDPFYQQPMVTSAPWSEFVGEDPFTLSATKTFTSSEGGSFKVVRSQRITLLPIDR